MILEYDTDSKWWVFKVNTHNFFYEKGLETERKLQNLVAELPECISEHLKHQDVELKILEERWKPIKDKPDACNWVRFKVIQR